MGLLIVLGGMVGGVDCCVSWFCFLICCFENLLVYCLSGGLILFICFNVGFLACCWFASLWVLILMLKCLVACV